MKSPPPGNFLVEKMQYHFKREIAKARGEELPPEIEKEKSPKEA